MSVRARLGVVVLWVASLITVAALVSAQTRMNPLASPVVLSGSDVGFRVEGQVGSRPAGVLVIRVNGQWVVPTDFNGSARLPASR
jgi:hypothetical protein